MIHDENHQFIGEAFVMFESVDDIEFSLWSVIRENKMIHGKHIKVFRHSQEQFQSYCASNTITKTSMYVKNDLGSSHFTFESIDFFCHR